MTNSSKRVIVTGATSFIGQAVTKALIKEGCRVFAVVRPDSPGRLALEQIAGAEKLCLIPGNLAAVSDLAKAPSLKEGASLWLHLGWEGAGSANRQNQKLQEKNIGYALDAMKTASQLGCSRFLFSGSQAEYGICDGPMTEDMECHPVSEYGKDKLRVCMEGMELSERLGLDYIHTRIFSVYGPGDHPWSLISSCIRTFLAEGHMEMGPCTQLWNFLYAADAADMLVKLLLGKAPSGVYNVAGEDTRPLRAYIEELYSLCGCLGTYEFGKRPPNAEGTVSLQPDMRKLRSVQGFSQKVSFAEGIRTLIALEKENRI